MKNEVFKHKMKLIRMIGLISRQNLVSLVHWIIWIWKINCCRYIRTKAYFTWKHTYLLDGDNIRHSLNSVRSNEDRDENIRRIGHLAELVIDAGLIVIAALSPLKDKKETRFIQWNEFTVFMISNEVCEKWSKRAI